MIEIPSAVIQAAKLRVLLDKMVGRESNPLHLMLAGLDPYE